MSHPGLVDIPGRQMLITFEDLISMRVIAFLRTLKYSFAKIRAAEIELRKSTGHLRPFATDDIWADKAGNSDIYSEMARHLLTATRHGQLAFMDLLRENLTSVHGLTFDEKGIASSWMPRKGIRLHPLIQFGRPCIDRTRIPTVDIAGMVFAGDSVRYLAGSYEIEPGQVEAAIAWEEELARL